MDKEMINYFWIQASQTWRAISSQEPFLKEYNGIIGSIIVIIIAAVTLYCQKRFTDKQIRSQFDINVKNRIQDKKQELIVALDVWESLLSDLEIYIKYKKVNREEHTTSYFSPFLVKLNLCYFLMEEYDFVSKTVREIYFNLSTMIVYLYVSPKMLFIEYLENTKKEFDENINNSYKMQELINSLLLIEKPNNVDGWLQYKQRALALISNPMDRIQKKLHEELRDK